MCPRQPWHAGPVVARLLVTAAAAVPAVVAGRPEEAEVCYIYARGLNADAPSIQLILTLNNAVLRYRALTFAS